MDTRQHLVEDWKAKLAANSQPAADGGERFAWIRQVYTRIYRFLVTCYGEGEWRGNAEIASLNADSHSNTSHMPFVECVPPGDGLLPKSPELIRAALESIHDSNPGIAAAGTMGGVEDDSWVVVDAWKKSEYARAVHRRLVAYRIKARLQHRTTDTAVIVRHADFQKALAVVQAIGRPRQIRIFPGIMKWTMEPTVENVGRARKFRVRRTVDPASSVGVFLLFGSLVTFLALMLFNDAPLGTLPFYLCTLWFAGLAAGWLLIRSRRSR
ncbi:MAG: hypothetical protein ABI614_27860 [Planctomycetota bacterium]